MSLLVTLRRDSIGVEIMEPDAERAYRELVARFADQAVIVNGEAHGSHGELRISCSFPDRPEHRQLWRKRRAIAAGIIALWSAETNHHAFFQTDTDEVLAHLGIVYGGRDAR